MKNIKKLREYSNELFDLNAKIANIQKASMDILKNHIETEYIGKFVKLYNTYYLIKSVNKIEYSTNGYYRAYVTTDMFCKDEGQFGLLISYKNIVTSLSFTTDGISAEHDILKDFSLDKFHVITNQEQTALMDYDHDMLSVGCRVHFFENNEVKEGVVIGFDYEYQQMKVKINSDNDYHIIPSNCLIRQN